MNKSSEAGGVQERVDAIHRSLEQSTTYAVELVKARVSDIIYELLSEKRLTHAQLAQELNVSRPYVSKLLRGDVNFTIETLVRIARALGMHLDVERLFVQDESHQTRRAPWPSVLSLWTAKQPVATEGPSTSLPNEFQEPSYEETEYGACG